MAKQTEADPFPPARRGPGPAEASRSGELPADWFDRLKLAMADNDYDSFLSLTDDCLRLRPGQTEEARRQLDLAEQLFSLRREADQLGLELLDKNYDPGLFGHKFLFSYRVTTDGVELLDAGKQHQTASQLIDEARDWQSVPEFGAIDGHSLASLASWGLLSYPQAADLAQLACSDDEAIAGREVLIDRLLRACSFRDDLLVEMLQRCQADYSFEAASFLPPAERRRWPHLKSLVQTRHQEKQAVLKKSSEAAGAESDVSGQKAEIDRLAAELELTESGREILAATRPVIHDLGSPGLSLGFKPAPDFIDGFSRLAASEQSQLLRQVDQDLNQDILASLASLSRSDGWYQTAEHRISLVKSHFVDSRQMTLAHELIHAAESSLSLDDLHRLYQSAAIYAQLNSPTLSAQDRGPVYASGRIPADVARSVVGSSRRADLLFDGGGGDHLAQFIQSAQRPLQLDDGLRIPPARPFETAAFLSELIASAGTEIANLPSDLEDYYRRIFCNRRTLLKRLSKNKPVLSSQSVWSLRLRFHDAREAIRIRASSRTVDGQADHQIAIQALVGGYRQLDQLVREVDGLIEAQTELPPSLGGVTLAQLHQIANESQLLMRQSLDYIYDINCLSQPLTEVA